MRKKVKSSVINPEILQAIASNPEVLNTMLGADKQALPVEGAKYEIACDPESTILNLLFCEVSIINRFAGDKGDNNCKNEITVIVKPLCKESQISMKKNK